jgi:hypothetical protein
MATLINLFFDGRSPKASRLVFANNQSKSHEIANSTIMPTILILSYGLHVNIIKSVI